MATLRGAENEQRTTNRLSGRGGRKVRRYPKCVPDPPGRARRTQPLGLVRSEVQRGGFVARERIQTFAAIFRAGPLSATSCVSSQTGVGAPTEARPGLLVFMGGVWRLSSWWADGVRVGAGLKS